MARVLGSYPIGRWFKSYCRYQIWPVGQEVKTPPFHGGIMGSIPVRVTRIFISKPRKIGGLLIFIYLEKQPLGLIWDLSYLVAVYPVLWRTMFL